MLKLYNSLTRSKQTFHPIEPGKVRMYVCGMTVYDYCHLGHARVMVVFDMVRRWLRASGYAVTYVRNITDIDDKIIKRAAENGESMAALTARFIQAMEEDAAALGVEKPDAEPRATAYVPQMQALIRQLEQKGLAYVAADGDVDYSVRDFPGYGKLSGKSLDDLRAGERVEVDRFKRDPLDFVLWKHAKPEEPADAQWDSPWGAGRPGWHIECSAMSCALLGDHFDIHGGGQDLQFPHHENEIAQSEGAHGGTLANFWLHNGFVRVDDEKMSKSLGNFFTVREILAKGYDPEVVRFFILRAHYRSPLNYSDAHLDDAKQALTRLYTALKNAGLPASSPRNAGSDNADSLRSSQASSPRNAGISDAAMPPALAHDAWESEHAARFKHAMDDDLNTAEAIAVLFDLANEANREKGGNGVKAAAQLQALANTLGLLTRAPEKFLQGAVGGEWSEEKIAQAIHARAEAKKNKNYAAADDIRKTLLNAGIVLEDTAQGTVWRRN